MKKIAVLAMPLDDLKTGLGWYIYRFVKNLALYKSGHNCTVFICSQDKCLFDKIDFPQNWTVHLVPSLFSSGAMNIFWVWWKSLFLGRTYDEVYYPALNRRAPLISSRQNTGFLHDLAEYHFARKYSVLRNIYVKKVLACQSRNVRVIFTNSAATAHDVQQYYAVPTQRIVVNYLGPEEKEFFPVEREEACDKLSSYFLPKKYLLYVSRLEHPAKNHIFMLHLFNCLKNNGHPSLQLVLLGSRWNNWEQVYKEIEQSPFYKDIYHFDNIPQEEMKYFYSGAACYIHPSLWEGFGFPVVEAMRCRCPVLVANNSSLKELVPSEEYCFSHLEEAKNKAERILQDTAFRQQKSSECYSHSERFSMKKHVEKYLDYIRQKD